MFHLIVEYFNYYISILCHEPIYFVRVAFFLRRNYQVQSKLHVNRTSSTEFHLNSLSSFENGSYEQMDIQYLYVMCSVIVHCVQRRANNQKASVTSHKHTHTCIYLKYLPENLLQH